MTTITPSRTHADIVSRVAALTPGFRSRLAQTEAQGRIPIESVNELVEAGVARLLVPHEYGGAEDSLASLVKVTMTVSAACPATGWCAMLMGHIPHQIALFPQEGHRAVWASGPDTRCTGVLMPATKAERVEGGYLVSGRLPFASGVDHSEWAFAGGMVPAPAGPPTWTLFLVERSQYTIDDTWDMAALRGTGSKTIVLDNVFVPHNRSMPLNAALDGEAPGGTALSSDLYRIPWVAFSSMGFAAAVVGAANGVYQAYTAQVDQKRTPSGERVVDAQNVQVDVGRARAQLDAAEAQLLRLAEEVPLKEAWTLADRAEVSGAVVVAVELALAALDSVVALSGTSGFADSSFIQRAWRDAHFAAAHISLRPVDVFARYGRKQLDVEEASAIGVF